MKESSRELRGCGGVDTETGRTGICLLRVVRNQFLSREKAMTIDRWKVVRLGLFIITCGVVLVPAAAQTRTSPGFVPLSFAKKQLSEQALRAHIKFLASDLLEGRGPASRGGDLAVNYLAAQLQAMGYEGAGPNQSYFQPAGMTGMKVDPSIDLAASKGSQTEHFKFGDDMVVFTGVQEATVPVAGEIIFAGFGITAPEQNWNDFKDADVKGKILLVLVNDPPSEDPKVFGGKALTYYGRWTYKFEEAARRGAAGAIIVHTTEAAGYGWNVVRSSWTGERFDLARTAGSPRPLPLKAWITNEKAKELVQMAGKNLDDLRKAAASRDFKPVPLGIDFRTTIRSSLRRLESPNVFGVLRGSDPKLRDEYVVYSAHWDHFGIRPDQKGDNIYNGAVDNASGCGAVLELAEAFARAPVRPKRSILIVFTTAEEQGLLGSAYYATHPLVPLAKTVANINIDSLNVLGATTDFSALGAERSTMYPVLEQVARELHLTISPDSHPEQGSFFRSDHFPLAQQGVPAVSLEGGTKFPGKPASYGEEMFEKYNNANYHQPSDEYHDDWDLGGAVQEMQVAFLLGWKVANQTAVPHYKPTDEFAAADRARKER